MLTLMGQDQDLIGHSSGIHSNPIHMSLRSNLKMLGEFLRVRKKWWLAPIIFFLLILSFLLVMAQGSAVAPFIYTLF